MAMYAWTSGIICAASVLFSKSGMEILKTQSKSEESALEFGLFACIVLGLLSLVANLHYLNAALKYYR